MHLLFPCAGSTIELELHEDGYVVLDQPDVKPPSCPVAKELTLEPYKSTCCKQWFSKTVLEQNLHKCPLCRHEPFVLNHDQELWDKLKYLRVQCSRHGCHWIGRLSEVTVHLQHQCMFVDVKCSSCNAAVIKGKMDAHAAKDCSKRPFSCPYCSLTSTYEDITKNHLPQCEEEVVPCPNNCGDVTIKHKQLKEHIDQCPHTTVKCEYSFAGCTYTALKHLMAHHNDIMFTEHRAMLVRKFSLSYRQLTQVQHDNEELKTKYNLSSEQVFSCLEYRMNDFYTMYGGWCSEPFYTHLGGYKMFIRANGSRHEGVGDRHLEVGVCLMRGEFDQELEFPFHGHVTVQLVEVNGVELKMKVKKTYNFSGVSTRISSESSEYLVHQSFATLKELHDISKNSSITTLKFRVTDVVAPPSIRCSGVDPQCTKLQEHLSHYPSVVEECDHCYRDMARGRASDGQEVMSMIAEGIHRSSTQVAALKEQNRMLKSLETAPYTVYSKTPESVMHFFEYYYKNNYCWISSAFYTHYGGYRLCLDVEGRGSDQWEQEYLCVIVHLCAGDCDDELSFPFYGEITVQLVDHGPQQRHVEEVFRFHENTPKAIGDRVTALTDVRNKKLPATKFIHFDELRDTRKYKYLVSNTLTFRVTNVVVSSGIKPPYTRPQLSAQLSMLLYLGMVTHEEVVLELLKDYPRYKVSRHGLVDSLIARFIIFFIGRHHL